jgi:hypothetical protein
MSEPSRPLRILVYGDDVNVREQVKLALGKRLHPELPELTYIDVATAPGGNPPLQAAPKHGFRANFHVLDTQPVVITTTTTPTTIDGPVEG